MLAAIVVGNVLPSHHAWIVNTPPVIANGLPVSSVSLRSSPDDSGGCMEDLDDQEREKKRMELVRSLQKDFYQSPGNGFENRVLQPTYDNLGKLNNVPLWRVQWTELPGRSNVLSVHEPIYTNMMEEIIRGSSPDQRFFGHLYLPGGSKNLRAEEPELKLKTWEDELELRQEESEESNRSAVLGTLMKISDYRRMEDGKLLLLVQAVERFVVTNIVQELPYGIADVQLLPDREEIQLPRAADTKRDDKQLKTRADGSRSSDDILYSESMVQQARAAALVASFQKWLPYEFEATPFPLPQTDDMAASEVVGSAVAKVLPFVAFDTQNLPTDDMIPPNMKDSSIVDTVAERPRKLSASTIEVEPQKPLEVCLLEGGILKEAGVPVSLLKMPLAELEVNLWLALNDFLKSSRTPVSPVLLGLLPPVGKDWPGDFVLESIADAIDHNSGVLEHKYVRVSAVYPSLRRQKRLSYYAAALLERNPDEVNELRQLLLQLPRYV